MLLDAQENQIITGKIPKLFGKINTKQSIIVRKISTKALSLEIEKLILQFNMKIQMMFIFICLDKFIQLIRNIDVPIYNQEVINSLFISFKQIVKCFKWNSMHNKLKQPCQITDTYRD